MKETHTENAIAAVYIILDLQNLPPHFTSHGKKHLDLV